MHESSTFPCNIEAEQAILGAILVNNEVFERVADRLRAEHFFDPVHAEIYRTAAELIGRGDLASPVILAPLIDARCDLTGVGGRGYLARLAGAAVSIFHSVDYAHAVREAYTRRTLLAAIDDARSRVLVSDRPEDAAVGLEARLVDLTADARRDPLTVSWVRALHEAITEANEAYQAEGPPPGAVPTGIAPLDAALGGLFPGDLVILGGRPSMGKSAIAEAIALGAARAGRGVLFASLEMRTSSVALRALSEALAHKGVRVPYRDARLGKLTEDQFREFVMAACEIEKLPIVLTPPTIRSIEMLQGAVRRAARVLESRGAPLSLIVFDYLQLAEAPGPNQIERVSAISKALKGMASRHDVPVLALSQLSRAVETRDDKRPLMADLRDSGSIEQDADVILFAYRDEYYIERQKPQPGSRGYDESLADWHARIEASRGKVEIIIGKQRMGDVSTVEVSFDPATNAVGLAPPGGLKRADQEAFL